MSPVTECAAPARMPADAVDPPVRTTLKVKIVRSPRRFAARVWQRVVAFAAFDIIGTVLAALIGLFASLATRDFLGLAQPLNIVTTPVLLAVFAAPCVVILLISIRHGHYSRIKPFWTEAYELVQMVFYSSALAVGLTVPHGLVVTAGALVASSYARCARMETGFFRRTLRTTLEQKRSGKALSSCRTIRGLRQQASCSEKRASTSFRNSSTYCAAT